MNTMLKKTPLLLALLVPSVAWAEGTVLMAPLLPKGVDAKVSNNITSLLSSELDFSGNYDAVKELPAAPPTLTAACLGQTTCLGGIAKANGVDAVVAGTVGPGTQGLQLYLVLYDARKNVIVRKKTFEASADSSTLATAATSYVNELVTGQSPSQAREEEAATVAAFNDTTSVDDDFAFDESEPPPKPATTSKTSSTSTAARTKVTTTVAPRALEDEGMEFDEPEQEEAYLAQKRAAEEEARRAEEERRLAAEAAARARAEAERKAREEAARLAREEAERKAREEAARLAREEAERKAREEAERLAREEAARAAAAKAAASRTSSTRRSTSDDELSFDSAAGEIDIEFGSSASGIVMEVEEDAEEDLDTTPYYTRSSSTKSSGSSTPSRGSTSSSSSRSSIPDFNEDEGETLSRGSSSRSGGSSRYEEEEEEPSSSIRDFDEEEPRASSSRSSSSSSRTTVSRSYDEDEEEPRSSIRDFDEEEEPRSTSSRTSSSSRSDEDEPRSTSSRSNSSSSSSRSGSSSSRYEDERRSSVRYQQESDRGAITITPRAGYARFYDFNFVTYGAELGVPVAPTAVLVVGIEGFSTQRELSEEVIEELSKLEGVPPSEINANPWNTILPINLGIQYKSPGEGVKPYAGADVTITPYTADFDVAFGARARVGADFMVADVFGFNLNLGAGIMSGSKFEQIQAGTKNTGLLPQVSAGTVFAF